jgi:hypothetical protein
VTLLLQGVEAEAELLSAVVTFFENVGITAADVGIKASTMPIHMIQVVYIAGV